MKLMIASDIHGSAYWLEKLMKCYAEENPDKLILLGDILYHGPRNELPKEYNPKKVIEILNGIKEKILCVRGNCDTEVDQMVLDFPILSDYGYVWNGALSLYLTHGHKYNEKNPPPLSEGDILLCGHTHIPAETKCGGVICINPGSVSIPKENSPNSYIIVENKKIIWKNLCGKEYKICQIN